MSDVLPLQLEIFLNPQATKWLTQRNRFQSARGKSEKVLKINRLDSRKIHQDRNV